MKNKEVFIIVISFIIAMTCKAQSCPNPNHPHMIDLGLPSGTKWACCNMGASKPESYGGYYAWGETQAKRKFNWNTYKYGSSREKVQDLGTDISGTSYDVAHVIWKKKWQIPTKEQAKELLDNTTQIFTKRNGVLGLLFKASNGRSIFIPAGGGI